MTLAGLLRRQAWAHGLAIALILLSWLPAAITVTTAAAYLEAGTATEMWLEAWAYALPSAVALLWILLTLFAAVLLWRGRPVQGRPVQGRPVQGQPVQGQPVHERPEA